MTSRGLRGPARLLAGLLLGLLAGCQDPTGLGAALPTVDTGTLSVDYTDTLTVRTSTVLADSVVSSDTGYLLLGRYQDARLGTITARSYLQLGPAGATPPAAAAVFDSLVLALTPDSYRYGDTTRTQTLQVHRLQTDLRAARTYYTADARPYDAAVLGALRFRAGRQLRPPRVRLDPALGRSLLDAARQGALSTQDELLSLLPGLVLAPAATDDAALLRFSASAEGSALHLYYHLPAAPATALVSSFGVAGGPRHFYQLEADRRSSLLAPLTQPRQALGSTRTAEETYIAAGLGLQTKVELPYLLDLRQLGGNIVVNAATLELEVVADSENRGLPPPATLTPRLTDAGNHGGAYFLDSSGEVVTARYQRGISPRTGLERGTYALSLTAYCSQALARSRPNQGLLLGAGGLAERVVLGSSRHPLGPLRLRVYFTRLSL